MQSEKKYFAAANTEKGFVSYYDEVYGNLEMTYIIKGGPGTGKSSFIRKIADKAENKGYSVEYFYCSSDPLSLDGIIIEPLKVAVIDGTLPHAYEPKVPGIKDRLINLGDNWDCGKLIERKDEICEKMSAKAMLYNNVYNYLAAAGRIEREISACNKRAVKYEKMKAAVLRIGKGWKSGNGFSKKLRMIEGISHAGHIVYDTYHNMAQNKYTIKDRYGIGSVFLEMIMKLAEQKRLMCTYSTSFLNNSTLSAIYLPEVSTSFVICDYADENTKSVNMERFVDADEIKKNKQKIRFAGRCLSSLYEGVQKGFDEIYAMHMSVEKIYSSAMDFEKNCKMVEHVSKEIFG